MKTIVNALTVDVEDYFQVSAFAGRICCNNWEQFECRVESNTNRILSIFDQAEVLGTFFILGWVADRYPALVRRIAAAGHEVASHGYWHQLVYNQTPEEFTEDISTSREAIYNACGVEVTAYRAPSFSIVPRSRWALDILAEQGFTLDSSVFPIAGHDRYGDPEASQGIHTIQTEYGSITEFPPTAGRLGNFPIPIGGGYFRFFPLSVTRQAIKQVGRKVGPAMFYIHPWEIDCSQPRIHGVSRKSKFRHYVGLKRTESKLRQLLKSVAFAPMSELVQSFEPIDEQTSGGVPVPVPVLGLGFTDVKNQLQGEKSLKITCVDGE